MRRASAWCPNAELTRSRSAIGAISLAPLTSISPARCSTPMWSTRWRRDGGWLGRGDRTMTLRALASDLLPDAILARARRPRSTPPSGRTMHSASPTSGPAKGSTPNSSTSTNCAHLWRSERRKVLSMALLQQAWLAASVPKKKVAPNATATGILVGRRLWTRHRLAWWCLGGTGNDEGNINGGLRITGRDRTRLDRRFHTGSGHSRRRRPHPHPTRSGGDFDISSVTADRFVPQLDAIQPPSQVVWMAFCRRVIVVLKVSLARWEPELRSVIRWRGRSGWPGS